MNLKTLKKQRSRVASELRDTCIPDFEITLQNPCKNRRTFSKCARKANNHKVACNLRVEPRVIAQQSSVLSRQ